MGNKWKERQEEIYPTWQEASKVVKKAGIRTRQEYIEKYKEIDERLPSNLNYYVDYPGWYIFSGNKFNRGKGPKRRAKEWREKIYPTWQEASKATIKLGIKNRPDYTVRYRSDKRLPSNPNHIYDDFPSWSMFFGQKTRHSIEHRKDVYKTWQEASKVTIKVGIKHWNDYRRMYKEADPKLPSRPDVYYCDFPGWGIFCGRSKNKSLGPGRRTYPTWQEASKVAINAGVRSCYEYYRRCKQIDSQLPRDPYTAYRNQFPGWKVFLSKKGR